MTCLVRADLVGPVPVLELRGRLKIVEAAIPQKGGAGDGSQRGESGE